MLALGRSPIDQAAEQVAAHVDVRPGEQVVEHGHVAEQLDVLERPGDPQPGDLVRLHAGDLVVPAVMVNDAAFLRVVQAADAVEQAGLARPVRPDDGQNLALADLQADVEEGRHPAEVELDLFDFELGFACFEPAAVQSAGESTLHRCSRERNMVPSYRAGANEALMRALMGVIGN